MTWADRVAVIRTGAACPCHGFAWDGGRCPVDVRDERARDADAIIRDAAADRGNRCADCGRGGFDRGQGWDWHHVDPATKVHAVGYMASHSSAPAAIRAEIAKCVLLCRSCHRLRHTGGCCDAG